MTDPRNFYTEKIPAQFNAALEAQERLGEEGRDLTEELRAVTATMRVDVTGEGGGIFYLNIEAGRMTPGGSPAQPPFLTMRQDRQTFDRLAGEVGDSAFDLLGGLSGLTGGMHLTRRRVDDLTALGAAVGLEIEGEGGFRVVTLFGPGEMPEEPAATIRIDAAVYKRLRCGELSAPAAFMEGKIQVEGDLQLAMQLALSAVAPD